MEISRKKKPSLCELRENFEPFVDKLEFELDILKTHSSICIYCQCQIMQ
jgi:hypothetical protein